jgi:nucleoid DNA-binding protein
MISIAEAISDLLFVRDTVVVPGLGAFVRKPRSAKVDLETNSFSMPSSQISFDAGLREENDIIIRYLVDNFKISENEAKRLLFHFVSDSFNSLKSGNKVVLKDIGTLSFGPDNEIVFEQDETANYNTDSFGLCDFKLEPIVREVEVVEETEQKVEEEKTPEVAEPETDKEPETEEERQVEIGKGVWPFMIGLVLIMSALLYFKVYLHKDDYKQQPTEMATEEGDTRLDPQTIAEEMIGEMMGQIIREELTTPSVQEVSRDTIRIIAGCYDREEPAQRMVNSLKNKGYPNAFMEQHGERWFVAYDRYSTEEEALEALREIRESGKGKGWILK